MRYIVERHGAGITLSLTLLLDAAGGTYAQDATSELQTFQQDDAQWALPTKNFAGTRYSSLKQINAENVANLEADWTFSTGVLKGHEGRAYSLPDVLAHRAT